MTRHGTSIEWTHVPGFKGESWNPVGGCSHASTGCKNCYAERLSVRLQDHPVYAGVIDQSRRGAKFNGTITSAPRNHSVWTKPLRWRKPRAIFTCDMSDLFHEARHDADIDRVMELACLCPQHIFMFLTKRSERMRNYFNRAEEHFRAPEWTGVEWPLRNVWLGVSAENQERLIERTAHLASTPAAVRFLSYEPALGPLNAHANDAARRPCLLAYDWVIAGGESGPRARCPNPDWFRDLRDQCAGAGVPFFFKQWGAWGPRPPLTTGTTTMTTIAGPPTGVRMMLVGKANASRALDGRTHDAFPEARP